MRSIIVSTIIVLGFSIYACNEKEAAVKPLCSDPCLKDTVKVMGDNDQKPYVYILPANCFGDTIVWSYKNRPNNRKIIMSEYTDRDVAVFQGGVKAYFKDTSYLWLAFNDCSTSRGYLLKLPYNPNEAITKRSSALNSLDPKFNVAEGLIAYTDYTKIYIEDPYTGKAEQVPFSDKELEIDFNDIHKTFDTVFINHGRAYIKLKGQKAIEKNLSL